MKALHLGLLASALLAAGCTTLGPNYSRPALTLPAQYPATPADVASSIAPDWWTLFEEPELTRLVQQALAANTDIAQAVARVEQAQGQLREARGATRPTLNASGSANRSQIGNGVPGNTSGRTSTSNDVRIALSTSFEIDLWGQLARATEAARAQLLAGQAARDTVRLTVAGAVAQTWFALRSLDAQTAASRRTLQSRESSARLSRLRLQAGSASRLEAEQAEILRADAALLLRELERQRAAAQTVLGQLVGEAGLTLVPSPLATAVPALPAAGLPSELLGRRPDIARAEAALVAANAQIGVARAALFPKLSLTAALGQESPGLGALLNASSAFGSIGLGLVGPLLDGGRNAARVDQATGREREALAAYEGTVLAALRDVADALANARAAAAAQANTASRAAAAAQAEQLAQARFTAGYAGSLELLDAQRTATAVQLDVVRNRQARLNASVDLFKALGGGWTPPTP